MLFNPIPDTNQGWAYPAWETKDRNVLIYKDDKFELYKNTKALSRASLFYSVEVIKDDNKILERFYSENFDFRKTLILDEEPGINGIEVGSGSASFVLDKPNKIVIDVKTDTQGLLFLSDNFYLGWKATVNGKPAKIYRADYTFRAVSVPAGESTVEFTYKPLSL